MPPAQPLEQRPSAPVRPQLPRNVAYRSAVTAISPASAPGVSAPGSVPARAAQGSPVPPGPPDKTLLRHPNPAEFMWLEECRDHLLAPEQPVPTLAWLSQYFDRYLEHWMSLPLDERWNPKTALNSISVLLGDLACRQVPGAKWMVEQTGDATSAIVAAGPELSASPFVAVFSAWQRGFPDAMYGAFTRIVTPLIPPVSATSAVTASGAVSTNAAVPSQRVDPVPPGSV